MIVRILSEDPPTHKQSLFLTTEHDPSGEEQKFLESLITQIYEYLGKRAGTNILPSEKMRDGNETTTDS